MVYVCAEKKKKTIKKQKKKKKNSRLAILQKSHSVI